MNTYLTFAKKNYMRKTAYYFIIACLLGSCGKESNKAPLNIPSDYLSADYSSNTVAETGIRIQMSSLTSYMKKGENIANKLTLDSLNYYYSSNGTPSIASITQAYYKNLITGSWFSVMEACSQNSYNPNNGATATNGGVFGARLLDKRSKETLQEIEKGLFEAALYNHFINLTAGNIDVATVDKMLCIYGCNPNFPNTNTASNTTTPDAFIALYAARRDNNDGTGLYFQIKKQFLQLQAAVNAGSAYNSERDAAIIALKALIEKAIMATVIHYGYAGTTKLSTSNPPETTISGGLHDFGEAVGFVHGFKSIPQEHRIITDAEIDQVLGFLLAPAGQDAAMYRFVTDGVNTLPGISSYQMLLKDIYDFSEADMEGFKQNWISLQGR